MRIFVNAQSAFFGGGLEYLKNQLKALRDVHKDIHLIVWTNNKNHKDLSSFIGKERTVFIKFPYLPYYIRVIVEQAFCPLLAKKYHADVIYMPGNVACFFTLTKQVLVFQNPNLFFNVVKSKNPFYNTKRLFQRLIARFSIMRADRTIFISKNLKNRAIKGEHKNTFVLYSGVNIDDFSTFYDVERFKPYILSVSNITYHKNYPALLEAFEIIHKKYPKVHLVIAGKIMDRAYFNKITEKFRAKEVWEKIHFLGGIEHKYLKDLYKNATLYITTTLLEAFPLTPFEAMFFGIPVISSNASSLPEICQDAALYIDPHDPMDIAQKIELLLNDDAMRKQLVEKGKKRIESFTWKRHANVFYNIIKS